MQGGGDEANQGDAASNPESDVGGERDPEAAVEAAAATPVDQDERRGERHRRPFAEQREDEEQERGGVEERGPASVGAPPAEIEEQRAQPEEGVEDVLPLGDPGDRLDVRRVQRPEPRREPAGGRRQGQLAREEAHLEGVAGVQEHVVEMEQPRPVVGREPLEAIEGEEHRVEAGIAAVGPAPPERVGRGHPRILVDVDGIVPVDEVRPQRGSVRRDHQREEQRPPPPRAARGRTGADSRRRRRRLCAGRRRAGRGTRTRAAPGLAHSSGTSPSAR